MELKKNDVRHTFEAFREFNNKYALFPPEPEIDEYIKVEEHNNVMNEVYEEIVDNIEVGNIAESLLKQGVDDIFDQIE